MNSLILYCCVLYWVKCDERVVLKSQSTVVVWTIFLKIKYAHIHACATNISAPILSLTVLDRTRWKPFTLEIELFYDEIAFCKFFCYFTWYFSFNYLLIMRKVLHEKCEYYKIPTRSVLLTDDLLHPATEVTKWRCDRFQAWGLKFQTDDKRITLAWCLCSHIVCRYCWADDFSSAKSIFLKTSS